MSIGGKTKQEALEALENMSAHAVPIGVGEHLSRIRRAQAFMQSNGIAALYLNAGSNLTYFSGTRWSPSERLVGAILPAAGELVYIAPAFEEGTIRKFMLVQGEIACWEEHENPAALLRRVLEQRGIAHGTKLCIDESTPLLMVDAIRAATSGYELENAYPLTSHCRMRKSEAELALIQCAMDMTMAVHRAAGSILHEGITTAEVEEFIQLAHRKVGASGSYFCIVLFGEATSYPHGVNYVQTLKRGDTVLIDTGCKVHNYISDITRTYVFGEASERQKFVWQAEKRPSTLPARASPAKKSTRPQGARSRPMASGQATSCRDCRTGPATASASTSTKGPTWSVASAGCSSRGCASRTSP